VNYQANAFTLSNFQAIPEPSTYILLTIGGIGALFAERRRRRGSQARSLNQESLTTKIKD
jgi:hypothetical protein